ncbi:DUF4276 family protein [Modicisalibacter coralii]|uniref:DUF4276 family protein n=1 Tax=Modicisalibacter coralii TaxID=2304602 RepID=UPI00100BF84A|nr:DUF4276 family protein [Halomonas coralii]
MSQLVFFLEEPSAREMLKGLLPRLIPEDIQVQYIVFEGKQDLEKRLPKRLRAWQQPDTVFVVLRDQDSGVCTDVKAALVEKCRQAGREDVLVRIACRELESFYLGDLVAVERAFCIRNLSRQQEKTKYRSPDRLGSPHQELKRLVSSYQKVAGSRSMGPHLSLDQNHSHSFNALISGVRRLLGIQA